MATPSRRIVLNTFGTQGDVLPFIGLARRMQALGHRPVVATASDFEAVVRAHGVDFAPAGPHLSRIARDLGTDVAGVMKRAFDPWSGANFLLKKMVLPYFQDSYAELRAACRGADLLVSQPMTPCGHLVAHELGLPWRTVVLQPMPLALMSAQDPAVISNHVPVHRLHGLLGERGYRMLWSLIKRGGRPLVRAFDAKARELGIYDRDRHPLFENVFSPQGTVALFPQWLMRQPLPTDLPPRLRFAGFSYFDGSRAPMPAELQAFLDAGEPPVAFTLGSAVVLNPGRIFEEGSRACEALGLRAVFLAGPNALRRPVPESQIVVPWASHAALFPRCRAIVGQAGIGTLAQAVRAGLPQILVPHAHDQPDNASRLSRLGAAISLTPRQAQGRHLALALQDLLSEPRLGVEAARLGRMTNAECGTLAAASWLLDEPADALRQAA